MDIGQVNALGLKLFEQLLRGQDVFYVQHIQAVEQVFSAQGPVDHDRDFAGEQGSQIENISRH